MGLISWLKSIFKGKEKHTSPETPVNIDSKANQKDNKTQRREDIGKIKGWLWLTSFFTIVIGIGMIGFISCLTKEWQLSFGSGVLIAGGAILSGAFMGFIFGIPSITQDNTARLRYNDNLVQISDWLTKIIVGVGLTQLYNIPAFVRRIGNHFKYNFYNTVPNPCEQECENLWGRNVSIAIMIYFFILGFLMIYFWTKTDYSTVMKATDEELNEVKRELEDAKQENEEKEQIINTQVAVDNKKRTKMVNDPQKGQWGGKLESNGRKVTAIVKPSTKRTSITNTKWFDILIEVFSIDTTRPLTGDVLYHLHPSFPNIDRTVAVKDGKAVLELTAYGAFTVGIECDNGSTKLEIDLAKDVPDAPQLFKER